MSHQYLANVLKSKSSIKININNSTYKKNPNKQIKGDAQKDARALLRTLNRNGAWRNK